VVTPRYRGSCPKAWTLDIQPQPAKQFGGGIQAKAATFEPLQFVVESFDETTVMPTLEIIENPVLPAMPGIEEGVKTMQARRFDLLGPALESGLGGSAIQNLVKNGGQQRVQQRGGGAAPPLPCVRNPRTDRYRLGTPWLSTRRESTPGRTGKS